MHVSLPRQTICRYVSLYKKSITQFLGHESYKSFYYSNYKVLDLVADCVHLIWSFLSITCDMKVYMGLKCNDNHKYRDIAHSVASLGTLNLSKCLALL